MSFDALSLLALVLLFEALLIFLFFRVIKLLPFCLVSLASICIAGALYMRLGDAQGLAEYRHRHHVAAWLDRLKTPENVVIHMEEFVKKHPDDPKAWHLLGRLYSVMNRPDDAERAFLQEAALKKEVK